MLCGFPSRSPEQEPAVLLWLLLLLCWLLLLLAAVAAVAAVVEWCGTAVRMKMGEMGSTESVGCGERQISSPASKIQIRIHPPRDSGTDIPLLA
jgi:hypothetical protein